MRRKLLLALAGVYLAAGSAAAIYWRASADPAAALYAQRCAACHGAGMEGAPGWDAPEGAALPPPLNGDGHAWRHSDTALAAYIGGGGAPYGGTMPAFAGVLTTAQIRALAAYLKASWPPVARAAQDSICRLEAAQAGAGKPLAKP